MKAIQIRRKPDNYMAGVYVMSLRGLLFLLNSLNTILMVLILIKMKFSHMKRK